MKKKIILFAIIICIPFCLYIYKNYKNQKVVYKEKIYLIQKGVFKQKNNVVNMSKTMDSYIIKESNDLYYIYAGVTLNANNIDIILEALNLNKADVYIKEQVISNKETIDNLKRYDEILSVLQDKESKKIIIKELINNYNKIESEV